MFTVLPNFMWSLIVDVDLIEYQTMFICNKHTKIISHKLLESLKVKFAPNDIPDSLGFDTNSLFSDIPVDKSMILRRNLIY